MNQRENTTIIKYTHTQRPSKILFQRMHISLIIWFPNKMFLMIFKLGLDHYLFYHQSFPSPRCEFT